MKYWVSRTTPRELSSSTLHHALATCFTSVFGGDTDQLKRVLPLGQPKSAQELAQLVAALGDEDGNIRWLAGNAPAVRAQEARRVLGVIAETAADEQVRQMAKELLEN